MADEEPMFEAGLQAGGMWWLTGKPLAAHTDAEKSFVRTVSFKRLSFAAVCPWAVRLAGSRPSQSRIACARICLRTGSPIPVPRYLCPRRHPNDRSQRAGGRMPRSLLR